MKRLWKVIPPCLSDVLGFQAVIHQTDGLGVVDDSSPYKPLNQGRNGMRGGPGGGRPGGGPRGGGRGGRGGPGRGGSFGIRVVPSWIQESDVVNGTASKVMEAFLRGREEYQPTFTLLTTAPCAAMIHTDLDEIAREIQEKHGLPAGVVALDGQRDYLYGISCTLEAMGKLLLEKKPTLPNTVNLLGCHAVDWPESAVQEAEQWLTGAGFQVLTKWGAKETAGNLKRATEASVNLVVNISGLRLAQYMEREFQIPYVVGAPYGEKQCARLLEQLKHGQADAEEPQPEGSPEVLVIGEQLTAQAIRSALLDRGWKSVGMCSFFELDKQLGGTKLNSEDDLSALLADGGLRVVFGDSDCRLAAGRSLPWIPLPNPANQAPAEPLEPFSMVGASLDRWLDEQLAQIN